MGSVDDFSQLCRLCLVKDQVNIPIFDESSDIEQTSVKINSCLPVKVSRDDNLPKKICDGCSYKLDMLYMFRNTSVDSEKQLISWLSQAGLSTTSQVAKDPLANTKPEIMVKQETFDVADSRAEGDNPDMGVDAHNYLIQQQQLPYQQGFEFGEPSGSTAELTDEPAPKRAKRAVLKKAPIDETDEGDEDDDDLDAAMQITKAEEEDSDDVDQPDYVDAPSTSADDQPGPSGVGKTAVEAPYPDGLIKIEDLKIQLERNTRGFLCRKCDILFPTLALVRQHRRQVHWVDKFLCSQCGKKYPTTTELKKHAKTHDPKGKVKRFQEKFHCDVCKEDIAGGRYTYYRHKASHEQNRLKWKCCGIHYRSARSYQRHYDAKHRTEEHKCEICGKVFIKKEGYVRHKRRHEEGFHARFSCSLCEKRFSRNGDLQEHINVYHRGEKYLCDTCGKEVTSASSLRDHIKIHTQEKKFACTYCGKKFTRRDNLKVHIRVHTNEKPHVCNLCDNRYSQHCSLTLHMRAAHTGEKPYCCVICSKSFISKNLLNSHEKTHAIVK